MATELKLELDLVNNDKITQFINVYHVLIGGKIIVTKIKCTIKKKTGAIIRKEYADNENKLHRDTNSYDGEGPAIICYKNNSIISESWYLEGMLHRDNALPAIIRYKNGNIISESWYLKGMLHRDADLPSVIHYSDDGKITTTEEWYMNGIQYRNNELPHIIHYNKTTGKVSYVAWYAERHLLHRDPAKGPAQIWYNDDGSIKKTKYYVRGIQFVTPELIELKKLIQLLNNEEIAAVTNMIKLIKK